MADRKVLYLSGQYPAINHGYLQAEISILRTLGFDVSTASISPPDRPYEQLSESERDEADHTFYIKSQPVLRVAACVAAEFLRHPIRFFRGIAFALRLGSGLRNRALHAAYFAEAVLVGRFMRQRGIAHVHANFSATVALIVTQAFPVTMSWVAHGYGELHDPSATHLAERIAGSLFVRSVSRYGIAQMMLASERPDWGKLMYAPLGIDPGKFLPVAARPSSPCPTILCVGRLSPEKGQGLLLEALAILKSQGVPAKLRFVGDGPDRNWLARKTQQLGITDFVEFVGWVAPHDVTHMYASSDLCALSSLAEGIPVVLMEAMAMELACIAPRITGIPELIEHGVTGMLFTVGDAEDLAAQIGALLTSSELRVRIGKAGRDRVVRDYDLARNTVRFAEMLSARLNDLETSR